MGGRALSAPSSSSPSSSGPSSMPRRSARVRVATSEAAASSDEGLRMISIEENAGKVFPTNLRCALQVRPANARYAIAS